MSIFEPEAWAVNEFAEANFGDHRLTCRLIKLAETLANSPESSINHACGDWQETKAAYRLFNNEKVEMSKILDCHRTKTIERSLAYAQVLSIQDTTYMTYTKHKSTFGLGMITDNARKDKKVCTKGLIMHTSFVVTTEGLPIGILDQTVSARQPVLNKLKTNKGKRRNALIPIEDKESMRWLTTLKKSHAPLEKSSTQVITVCDREADMYDFFECANKNNSKVLVRASQDRAVNKVSRFSKKNEDKLWGVAASFPSAGECCVEIPARHGKLGRVATLEIRFGKFTMNPPQSHIRHKRERLSDIDLHLVYVSEKTPGIAHKDKLEWMLLTNLSVNNFAEATEKVRWYCMRWRIEIFHKILKSGLKVEECKLGSAERLKRYLTVMSIIAWRIFFIALIARTNPDLPCTILLTGVEWKVTPCATFFHNVTKESSCVGLRPREAAKSAAMP